MIDKRTLSITQLYEDNLETQADPGCRRRRRTAGAFVQDQAVYGPDVVGHLNLIYSHRVQVIGKAEQNWAASVGLDCWHRQVADLIAGGPPALIIADGLETVPGPASQSCARRRNQAGRCFSSPKSCSSSVATYRQGGWLAWS